MPVEVEFNLDPLEITKAAGILGAVAVAGGLVAYVAWNGLALPTPFGAIEVIPGLKKTEFWKGQADKAEKALLARQTKKESERLLTLSQRCADAKTGLSKLKKLLRDGGCQGDLACEQSVKSNIATLEAFIAAECG